MVNILRDCLKEDRIETNLKGRNDKIPTRFVNFQKSYPDLFQAYEELGKQASVAGPLDKKQIALIKVRYSLWCQNGRSGAFTLSPITGGWRQS